MIKHIVMWKLFDEAEGNSKEKNSSRIKEELLKLALDIPQIINMEVGINTNTTDHSFDVVLYSEFSSKEDLQFYQDHPAHISFKTFIQKLRTHRYIVDYEV